MYMEAKGRWLTKMAWVKAIRNYTIAKDLMKILLYREQDRKKNLWNQDNSSDNSSHNLILIVKQLHLKRRQSYMLAWEDHSLAIFM